MKTKLETKLEAMAKLIGIIVMCIILVVTELICLELGDAYVKYRKRGFSIADAMELAEGDVQYEINKIDEYMDQFIPKVDEYRWYTIKELEERMNGEG